MNKRFYIEVSNLPNTNNLGFFYMVPGDRDIYLSKVRLITHKVLRRKGIESTNSTRIKMNWPYGWCSNLKDVELDTDYKLIPDSY